MGNRSDAKHAFAFGTVGLDRDVADLDAVDRPFVHIARVVRDLGGWHEFTHLMHGDAPIPSEVAPERVEAETRQVEVCCPLRLRTRLLVRRRLGIQRVFSVPNNAVPIIN
jgi:hypothetical protein